MVTSKWYLGLFLLFFMVAALCLVTEGNFIGAGQISTLNQIVGAGWGSPGAIFNLVLTCLTWKFAFFETGIGIWIKVPLMCLSAAIVIPLAFEVFRLLFKPFGG